MSSPYFFNLGATTDSGSLLSRLQPNKAIREGNRPIGEKKTQGAKPGLRPGLADHLVVPAYGLVFAPHPTDYIWWNNSSTVIAGWLAEMGVEVTGLGLIASWQVELEG